MAQLDIINDPKNGKWRRVRKDVALVAYSRGEDVLFCPCKLYPFGPWQPGVVRRHEDKHDETAIQRFTRLCGEILQAYPEPECGRYLHYYVRVHPASFGLKTRPEETLHL
ncbi:hypothetical protein PU634_10435 [Oceanimonas pelagia]|uniref:Uncharacterized protein n=1 Tax=Oceanimonas pelagia TaxID=3028314 RepID=A0AA50Q948_9GAMM|nr:hypothetical protein [Oceanimonas pelagia]WMC09533.1 hypothetical protein PU634_10435 [Oceanimonas pelagia]